jgi:hypothetical protein
MQQYPYENTGFSAAQPTAVYPSATGCSTIFHIMEAYMTDYRLIESNIQHARLERSRLLGELIGNGIYSLWSGSKQLAVYLSAKIKLLVETPDEYSTALPRHF